MPRLLIALILAGALAAADDSPRLTPVIDWAATVGAAGYEEATAGEPRFADKALWPQLGGKEAYVAQTWPKTRTLVWAKPGESGSPGGKGRGAPVDATDPANWLEDGKPASQLWDADTDIVMPGSDKPYSVTLRDVKDFTIRHLTIGRGCRLGTGGDGIGRGIAGNVWIKAGGETGNQGVTRILGAAHTFWRNDNVGGPKLKIEQDQWRPPGKGSHNVTQYFKFERDGGSIEYLGHNATGDEFMGNAGTIIVGPDSILQPGRSASPFLDSRARLVLMDGAYFGTWMNDFQNPCLVLRDGAVVEGGSSERPLARDAYLAIGLKNHSAASYDGPDADKVKRTGIGRVAGLVVGAGSALRTVAAPGSRARLTVTFIGNGSGFTYLRLPPGSKWERETLAKDAGLAQRNAWFDALPPGIDLWFAADARAERVRFDHLRAGGLMSADGGLSARVTDAEFGPACHATGPALFSTVAKLGKGGGY